MTALRLAVLQVLEIALVAIATHAVVAAAARCAWGRFAVGAAVWVVLVPPTLAAVWRIQYRYMSAGVDQ